MTITSIYPVVSLFQVVIHPEHIATLELKALPNRNALFSVNIPDGLVVIVSYPCEAPLSGLPQEAPLPIAVLARALSRVTSGPHREDVVVQGLKRVQLDQVLHHNHAHDDGLYPFDRAVIREMPFQPITQHQLNLIHELLTRYEHLIGTLPNLPKEKLVMLRSYQHNPEYFADLFALTVRMELRYLIEMMRELEVEARLEVALDWLEGEVEKLEIDRDLEIKSKIDTESSRHEYHLRQKLKLIRRELGEEDHTAYEADDYTQRLLELELDDEVTREIQREIKRLRHIPSSSNEFQVIKTMLDRFFELPWGIRRAEEIDLSHVRRALNEEHFGLAQVKERILEFLAVRSLNPDHRGPILCFAGPPGVGKTSLGQAIADSIGRTFHRISVGGVSDEAEIRGHRRTYVGAMPGKILSALTRAGCENPLLMLDEIDKISHDHRGDPASALLEVLDPEQNSSFTDHYFNVPFDLSSVMFIVTANYLRDIPAPLLDRLEIINIEGYTESEKVALAQRHLMPRVLKDHGLISDHELTSDHEPTSDHELTSDHKLISPPTIDPPIIDDRALREVIRGWTREAGVRDLKRNLQRLCRKVALARVEGGEPLPELIGVGLSELDASLTCYLGPRQHRSERSREAQVGLARGLAWTPAGGEVLMIEVIEMQGTGKLIITGKLGEVMRESVQAAHSLIRARAESLSISPSVFQERDLHIHFPAGAIPKDGPSAGVTVTIALASRLSGRPVRSDLAMTGEVTLLGEVLPVGGIRDKVLAAHRAGLAHIALPSLNQPDLAELPEELSGQLEYHLLDHIDALLAFALSAATEVSAESSLEGPVESLEELTPELKPELASDSREIIELLGESNDYADSNRDEVNL